MKIKIAFAAILGFGIVSVGCGAEPGDEAELDSVQQAWGACTSSTANYSATGRVYHTSPSTYNTCTKSYIVDLWSPDTTYHTDISADFGSPYVSEEVCEDRFLGVWRDTWNGSSWVAGPSTKVFGTYSGGYCNDPVYTHYPSASTRYVVTARPQDSSSAPVVGPLYFYSQHIY